MTESRGQAPSTHDPEAEQEVDFGRYWRLLGTRWWLPAAGIVIGAIVGYGVALGGSQVFKATASIYLGQPYTSSGNVQLQSAQTNPSTVRTIIHSPSVIAQAAGKCKTKPGTFSRGISTQAVAGNITKNGQTPEVTVTVQAKKRRVASCAANALAAVVVDKTSAFANQKINNFRAEITLDDRLISTVNQALTGNTLSTGDKLVLQLRLLQAQQDRLSTAQLLSQANQVEKPSIITGAHSTLVTARSRRNTVVVAALIGLVIGALAALLWDGFAAGYARRRRDH